MHASRPRGRPGCSASHLGLRRREKKREKNGSDPSLIPHRCLPEIARETAISRASGRTSLREKPGMEKQIAGRVWPHGLYPTISILMVGVILHPLVFCRL